MKLSMQKTFLEIRMDGKEVESSGMRRTKSLEDLAKFEDDGVSPQNAVMEFEQDLKIYQRRSSLQHDSNAFYAMQAARKFEASRELSVMPMPFNMMQQSAMMPNQQQSAMMPNQQQCAMMPNQQSAMMQDQQNTMMPDQQSAMMPNGMLQPYAMMQGMNTGMVHHPGMQMGMEGGMMIPNGMVPNYDASQFPQGSENVASATSPIDDKSSGQRKNTTVMVKNIPNKYTQRMLLNVFRQHGFDRTFDFLYAPIDLANKANVGYAFVNFIEHRFAADFIRVFDGTELQGFRSRKVMEIAWAKTQGIRLNIKKLKGSAITQDHVAPEYQPLLFDPNTGDEIVFPVIQNFRHENVPSRRDYSAEEYDELKIQDFASIPGKSKELQISEMRKPTSKGMLSRRASVPMNL